MHPLSHPAVTILSPDRFYRTLRLAIVDTFKIPDLDIVVCELGKNRDAIVQADTGNRVVYNLLRVARNEGWLEELLKALAAERPHNAKFKATIESALATLAAQAAPEPWSTLDTEPEPGVRRRSGAFHWLIAGATAFLIGVAVYIYIERTLGPSNISISDPATTVYVENFPTRDDLVVVKNSIEYLLKHDSKKDIKCSYGFIQDTGLSKLHLLATQEFPVRSKQTSVVKQFSIQFLSGVDKKTKPFPLENLRFRVTCGDVTSHMLAAKVLHFADWPGSLN